MAIQLQGTNSVNVLADSYQNGLRVSYVPHSDAFSISSVTGIMAAALAANSTVFAMRLNPGSPKLAYITQLRVRWVCLTAFTTPISVTGRRLALYRGAGAAASGGTALTVAGSQDAKDPVSHFNAAIGGDLRIATTAALTVTGITYESQEFETFLVATLGTAAATSVFERRWDSPDSHPIILIPGQVLAIRNPVVMEAAGTWNLGVDVEWFEL